MYPSDLHRALILLTSSLSLPVHSTVHLPLQSTPHRAISTNPRTAQTEPPHSQLLHPLAPPIPSHRTRMRRGYTTPKTMFPQLPRAPQDGGARVTRDASDTARLPQSIRVHPASPSAYATPVNNTRLRYPYKNLSPQHPPPVCPVPFRTAPVCRDRV
ncbi:hypothetical protein EDC01DRAFT_764799 [Geopyxis carbonaria]|nr:hypothetical protein EDC01DRAFT_764799 [Geopyxis carbonaria]